MTIAVTVADIRCCPSTNKAVRECLAFWDRWRGRSLFVGKPFAVAPGRWMSLSRSVPCETDLYWPVLGPPEFLAEFERQRFGEAQDLVGCTPVLCRHLIVGD